MGNLKKLTKTGQLKLSNEFLNGSIESIDLDDQCIEQTDIEIEFSEFNDIITKCIELFDKFDTSMDAFLAPKIHKTIRIDRRVASDKSIWHHISVAETPSLVRHRWAHKSGQIVKRRFLGGIGHNTIGRLWWGAEMTLQNADNYEYTSILFGNQDLYEAVQGRAFWQYPPALIGFLNIVGSETGNIAKTVAKNFNHIITTIVLESLSIGDVEEIVKDLLEQT